MMFFGSGDHKSNIKKFRSATVDACKGYAEQGNVYATGRMGISMLNLNVPSNLSEACEFLDVAARTNILGLHSLVKYSVSRKEIGGYYANFLLWSGTIGEHIRNKEIAFKSLVKAADAGLTQAQYALGLSSYNKLVSDTDRLSYLKAALQSGHPKASHGLYCYYSAKAEEDSKYLDVSLLYLQNYAKSELNQFILEELIVHFGGVKMPSFDKETLKFWVAVGINHGFDVDGILQKIEQGEINISDAVHEKACNWLAENAH